MAIWGDVFFIYNWYRQRLENINLHILIVADYIVLWE